MNYTWITPKDAGYIPGRSYIYSELVRAFPQTTIEEIDPELDCSADVDYIGKVGEKAFGIQIKIITDKTAANYSMSNRMRSSLREFEEDFGGKVFIVFVVNNHIKNVEIFDDIQREIIRLKNDGETNKVGQYRAWIRQLLEKYTARKYSSGEIETQVIEDIFHDHYQIYHVGWNNDRRIHGCVLHLDIKDGKIWIQHNSTEERVAVELTELGVPKEDIVLGFQAPYRRQFTEYAVQ